MKKSKKIFLRVLPVLMLAVMLISSNFIFAANEPISTDFSNLSGGSASNTLSKTTKNIWSTVTLILQILAVAAIVFAGVRYMFASADAKADIKKQLVILVLGAVLVFGASTIIQIIVKVTNDVAAI